MSTSLIYSLAGDLWHDMKSAYASRLEEVYAAADDACHGYLVNKAGRALHIESFTLFAGPEAHAYKYATRELVDWWAEHGRLTLRAFEAQWLNARGHETAYDDHWGQLSS